MKKFLFFAAFALLLAGCAAPKPEITQVNTIDSLLAGVYDGDMTLGELRRYGDFGIGTFDKLDGEMLFYRGVFHQIKGDGSVAIPGDDMTTPFASVVRFPPVKRLCATGVTFEQLCRSIDKTARNQNIFVAVAVTGEFTAMHTRSVPAQNKPYRPLAEVTRTQPEFKMENIRGTVVGFRLPDYVKGINVPGYHLHFISEDKQRGGHILGFQLKSGVVEVAEIHNFRMILPGNDAAFAQTDLSKDRSRELREVESSTTR